MNDFRKSEKLLKHHLKKKINVTIALVVVFLISGIPYFEEEVSARDLRARVRENNSIKLDGGGASMNISANNTDVVNIATPNANGISHNKFIDLSVGSGNGLIFNNSTDHGVSQIGGYVTKNPNLKNSASVILNEVTGNNISNINGSIEVFGQRADFILANENGINVNGATFINTNGVTLTTGRVTVNNSDINFDIQKGSINLNGVGTSGDYFNVLAKTIEIHKEISPIDGEKRPDITMIAGENILASNSKNLKNIEIKSSKKIQSEKYGIYGTELGAMYGNNIRLISTDSGLGVRHEGVIFSERDIDINSQGDIVLKSVNSQGNLKIKGKSLTTQGGSVKQNEKEYVSSVSAQGNVEIDVVGDVELNSGLQSINESVKIVAKNLTLADKSSAKVVGKKNITIKLSDKLDVQGVMIPTVSGVKSENLVIVTGANGELQVKDVVTGKIYNSKDITWVSTGIIGENVDIFVKDLENNGIISADKSLKIDAQSIINESEAVIKGATLNLKAKNNFINRGDIRENRKDLNEFVDPNGNLKIEVILGKFENYGNISGKKIDILIQNLINSLNGKIIATDGNIVITTTVGELLNNGEIFGDKNVSIISSGDLVNSGKIGGDNLTIKALKGEFLNAGHISAVKNLEIIVEALNNAGIKEEIERYLALFLQYSEKELERVNEILKSLEGKAELKETYTYYKEVQKNLLAIKEEISKSGSLGVITGKDITIKSSEDFGNSGIIIAEKDLTAEAKSMTNSGIIQAENSILLKVIENIINSGRVTAQNDITITAKSFISEGNSDALADYLSYLQKLDNTKLEELKKSIIQLEEQLLKEKDVNKIAQLKEQLKIAQEEVKKIQDIQNKLSTFKDLGVVEGNNIVITTVDSLVNNGVLISKGNLNLTSQGKIKNGGVTSVGKDATIKGESLDSNSLTVGGDLNIQVKTEVNSKDLTVGKGINISGSLNSTGELKANGKLNVTGDLTNSGKATVKDSITVGKGANSSGSISTGGDFSITGSDSNFISSGDIEVGKDLNINSKSVVIGDTTVGGKVDIKSGEDITTDGKLQAKGDISLDGEDITNSGNIVTDGNLTIDSSGVVKSKDISAGGDLNITSNGFENSESVVVGKNVNINSKSGDFSNNGTFHSQGEIEISGKNIGNTGEIIGSGVDLSGSLNNSGSIQSKGNISVKNGESVLIKSGGKLVATGDIDVVISDSIINEGMIVGNGNINLDGKNITNDNSATIWTTKNISLDAEEKIYNGIGSNIEAMGDISLKGKEIENYGGTIKSGKKMDIKTDSLINKSVVVEDFKIDGYTNTKAVTRWDQVAFYHLDYVYLEIPNIVDNSYVNDRASISSGSDISIQGYSENGKANVLNEAGTIASSGNLNIVGDIKNISHRREVPIEWILENTKVTLYWETKLYGGAHGNSGTKFQGSLKDALNKGYFNYSDDKFYTSLTQIKDPTMEKVLSMYLGADWKAQGKPISQDRWNRDGKITYIAQNGEAKIFAGMNLNHSGGEFINDGGESGGNKDVTVNVGDESVDGIVSNGEVNIGDINQIKEVDGVKQIHDVEIITGEVTLNGVIIKAEMGNTAGSIAVAGTINPIIFIDTPTSENGIFKPATPKPDGFQPIYETNIDFIDSNNFYGSDYFFSQIGYDKYKTSTVIGDAYYEYILLTKMIQEGIGYTRVITAENIKSLLDNALKLQGQLKLEIGKPLTPDQINSLDKDIIWYVEMEVNGQKALVPQIYFSNESRINIANSQGNGGSASVSAGGNFISDNTEFTNSNGNITANGNIIIKSEGDINNNSSGGVSGGITSGMGNVAIDAGGDVNIIGGSVKGDNVIVSGDNVNIESTLGTDENGNQIISDVGGISGDNGIQIDAKNDFNMKGGSLTASGVEVKPEEEEESSTEKGAVEEVVEEEIVKDVNYYEELFKKESADIIEGDAGSININAGGSVNIEDIYTVSSDRSQNNIDEGNYSESVSSQAKSNGSNIIGSNVNISAEEDVTLEGSTVATNDVLEKNQDEDLLPGSINISAKGDVNIVDSQDVSYEKNSSKSTTSEDGLLTVKWSDSEKSSSLSKGSNIVTGGDLNISSGNNIKIQGSDLTSLGDTNISAENDVEIVDGRDVVTENSSEGRYQVVGGGVSTSDIYSSKSAGSNIFTGGDLNVSSGNNIKIVNGNLTSSGDTKLKAENDISIEAGKNEYVEKTSSTSVGIYVDGNAGIGGVGVSGSASTGDMSASGEISDEWGAESTPSENLDGSNENTPTTSGKPHMDQLVNSEIGIKIENIKKEVTETTWSESQLQGENISIEAGNSVDIGGGDYKANENIDIKGKSINSTKYEDSKTEKTDGFTVSVKQSQGVNSAIADTINTGMKMDSAIKSGQANEGVLAAQGVGAASNIIFNDLAGVYSKQSVGVSIESSTTTETSENITSMDGKNINITATDGDINLAGVEINAEENVSLDAKNDINISSAKKTSSEDGFKVDLEGQLEQSAGYSALWGGNTDVGVGGSVNLDITKKDSETHTNSTINSGGNISIKSGGDTNIIGGEVEAKKDVNVDVGGNLTIESKKSSYDEHSINANAGANVSIGGSTNTIGKGELGFNAGGGDIWKSGETVDQSGIKSGGNLNVSVGGDLNITGGILGSETGNGSLDVGGDLNIKDIVTKEQQGGAHITVSGGLTGDMGVDGTIGDEQNKQVTSKSGIGLNPDNISVGGNISINGEKSSVGDINTDIENTQTVDYDVVKKGGDISLSGSIDNINDMKDLGNKIKNKITDSGSDSETPKIKDGGSKNSNTSNGDVVIEGIKKNKDSLLEEQNKIADKEKLTEIDKDKLEEKLKDELENQNKLVVEKKSVKEDEKIEVYSKGNSNEGDVTIPNYNFDGKNIDKVIDTLNKELAGIRKEQWKLITKSEIDNSGEYALDKKMENLKEAIKDYISKNSDKELNDQQKKQIEKILKEFDRYSKNSDKYLSGKPQEKKEVGNSLTIITRSDKDIRDNLQKVAEYSDKIPKEHLLDYLDRTIKNSDFNKLEDRLTGEGNEVILTNPKISHSEASEQALGKIYKDVTSTSDNSLREALNDELGERLAEDKKIEEILKNGEVTQENIKELAERVQNIKAEVFEELLGADYKKVKVEVVPPTLDKDLVGGNDGDIFKIYLQKDMDMKEIFEMVIHELTHQDQNNLKDVLVEGFEDLSKIYELNSSRGGYITRGKGYAEQPIEKEAFDSEKVADTIYDKIVKNGDYDIPVEDYNDSMEDSGEEFDFSENSLAFLERLAKEQEEKAKLEDKYSVLDKDNPFDFLKREDENLELREVEDTANEPTIVAEHYEPLYGNPEDYKDQIKNNGNENGKVKLDGGALERKNSKRKSNRKKVSEISSPLKGSVIVDGTRLDKGSRIHVQSRREFVSENPTISSPLKNIDWDKSLASLNGERLELLAQKFVEGKITTEDEDMFSNYKEGMVDGDILKHPDTAVNRIPSEGNREILGKILGSQLGAEGLFKINQAKKELEKNPEDSVAKEKMEEGIRDFTTAKSIAVLDKILTNGGKVYLEIDKFLVGSDGNIGFNNIFGVFDKENPEYSSTEASKIRHALERHSDNPNLKLTARDQVIQIPKEVQNKFNNISRGVTLKEGNGGEKKSKVKEEKQRIEKTNNGTVIVRGTKDVKLNLEKVSEKAESIPKEHLTDYLGKLVLNSDYSKIGNGKDTVKILNPAVNNDKETVKKLGKLYDTIYSNSDISFRKELDDDYISRVKNSSEIKELLGKEVTEQNLKELAKAVGKLKKESFEQVIGKKYETVNLVIKDGVGSDKNGGLSENILTLYLRPDRTMIDYLGTISHEYTHNDQRHLKNKNINEKAEDINTLYTINSSKGGYIDPSLSVEAYKNQPVEKEAFDLQNKVLSEIRDKTASEKAINEQKKLGIPMRNNNNLESNIRKNELGKTPLVYGTAQGRDKLVATSGSSLNNNPVIADAYLGKFNEGIHLSLIDFSDKVTKGTLTEKDKEDIINYKVEILNPFNKLEKQSSKVSSENNRELLNEMLASEKFQDVFKNISEAIERLNKENTKENGERLTLAIEEFFTAKTTFILEKTLNNGEQIYFSLDDIITDEGNEVDFNKLLDIYSSDNKYKNSVTSNELKLVFDKYLDNPNLKFVLNKQVIELPQEIKEKIKVTSRKEKFDLDRVVAQTRFAGENIVNKEEIKILKYVETDEFKESVEKLKNELKEKYGVEKSQIIDEVFDLEDFATKNEIAEYLRKELSDNNITLTEENLKEFSDKVIVKIMEDFESYRAENSDNDKEFKTIKKEGDKVFMRTQEGIKKQLELVAKDKNDIPAEHLQNFLANLFLNKEANLINRNIIDRDISVIANEDIELDKESNINLYSIYERIPNKFEEQRKNLDRLLVEELGKSEFLKEFITDGGEIGKEDFAEAYMEAPDMVIDRIYDLDIKDIADEDIEDILTNIQQARAKNFEESTGVEYQPSSLVIVRGLSNENRNITAYHEPKDNTITIFKEKLTTFGKLLDVLLHETQHNEQDLLAKDKSSDKVSEEVKEMYAINGQGYIQPKSSNPSMLEQIMYKEQPLEREAYDVMEAKEVIKLLLENLINS